ncbi:MAG TPA: PQQ-binding-like beta-propeller repeat protein, partial [Acidobacteriota bacterium]|nr:PQQ-binding-like beta-propeller repeat protein [Acidobacteriota bacterium]
MLDILFRMRVYRGCWLTLGLLCLTFVSVSGENWSRFRGLDGAGQSKETAIPSVWTKDDYLWRVELTGIGHSSPLVWQDQVIVSSALEADGTKIIQSRKTIDGSVLWETRIPLVRYDLGRSTSHDTASPAVDEKRVYLTWVSADKYHVAALDRHSGDEVWRRNLSSFQSQHGAGASPIRFGDLLIVPNDQAGPSSTLAIDCETGATRWSVDRRSGTTA